MPLTLRLWLCLLLVIPAAPAGAETERFRLDPWHTRVVFLVDHAGFSRAMGAFPAPPACSSSTRPTGPARAWTCGCR